MTNPAQRWFQLRLQESGLNEIEEVKTWLARVEDRIYDVLNASNFNTMIHQAYLDLGSVGTSVLYEEEDPLEIIRFQARFIEEIVIAEDSDGRVREIHRRYKLTVKQAYDTWGKEAGKKAVELYEKGKWDDSIEYQQSVYPREERDPSKMTAINMPYASVQINVEEQKVVAEGGFHEMPYFVTRFMKVTGDNYGYSPALVMLPDIKMLNAVTKTIIKAAQKIVDPPLVLPHDGFILPLKTMPAGINYRTSGNSQDKIEPLLTGGNIPVGRDEQQDLRNQIMQGYYADLFLMLAEQRKNMTATEVAERVAEKMLLLGPSLGRLQSEMLDPIIERTFGILLRKGYLPTPPEMIADRQMVIEYVSPLALAQKRESLNSISNLLALVGQMAQLTPEVLDKIDTDQVVDEMSMVLGVSPDIVRDDKQVAEIRQQRAQQVAVQETMAGAQAGADIVKTAAEADRLNRGG